MNGPLRTRDRGHRGGDPRGQSRSPRIMLDTRGLVYGIAPGALQQIEHLRGLAAIPAAFFLGGFRRFLRRAGLLSCLPLLERNVRALCANTGLFRGFRLLGGASFFNSCVHVISFRGNRRGDDMNRSNAPKMQVNSGRILKGADESDR